MATLVSCAECGKQISRQASSCPSCGHPNKAKHLSGSSVFFIFCGLALFLWWVGASSSGGALSMDNINKKVADDTVEQYYIAKRGGDPIQICSQAGMVVAAFMQAKDEANYQTWLSKQKSDCRAAGLP